MTHRETALKGKYLIGIDLGGTSIKAGILTEDFEILRKTRLEIDALAGAEKIVSQISAACWGLMTEAGVSPENVAGIGIGSPGLIDTDTGTVLFSNNFDWENVPLADMARRETGIPVRVANDANCAVLGESVRGSAQNAPKMITGDALRAGLCSLTSRPFRLVPYFDPGVWGGQWMKEVCHLDPEEKNYAWSFDGVPEENSLMLKYGDVVLETPAMNLTLYQPKQFLGEKTFARFGAEFPIRFDFLDTMGGQNLSLQVHPLTDYMYRKFGMPYTQDESYYILDCAEGEGGVYLGFKEGVDPTEFIADLRSANRGEQLLDAEKYVNRWPAKKHDHFLIPAGTIHCSSANCMVLEISATPYIFTFKLWDWDRLGLDGLPRPIHIDDGQEVLQYDRTTGWVKENLINRFRVLEENERYTETKTGLHELEFIETHVFDVREEAPLPFDGEFAMCNLVEGKAAVLESRDGLFAPYEVHYAETFILPARAGRVMIRPRDPEEPVRVIVAKIRYGC